LLDAELLAAVYIELTTTRQAALQLEPISQGRRTFRQSSGATHAIATAPNCE
jgi:hypothetical protein